MRTSYFDAEILLVEWRQDGKFTHFVLCVFIPLLFCVSLVRPRLSARSFTVYRTSQQFFCLQLIQNISMAVGPIAQYHQNSKYYSARPPRPNKQVDDDLPHITIQMPVYKEGLEAVLWAPFVLKHFLFVLTIFCLSCIQCAFGCIPEEGDANVRTSGGNVKYLHQRRWLTGNFSQHLDAIGPKLTLDRHSQIMSAISALHFTKLMVLDGLLDLLTVNQAQVAMARHSYVPVASRKPPT